MHLSQFSLLVKEVFNNLVRNFDNSYYSTVTDLAKFLGLSTSVPFANAT